MFREYPLIEADIPIEQFAYTDSLVSCEFHVYLVLIMQKQPKKLSINYILRKVGQNLLLITNLIVVIFLKPKYEI